MTYCDYTSKHPREKYGDFLLAARPMTRADPNLGTMVMLRHGFYNLDTRIGAMCRDGLTMERTPQQPNIATGGLLIRPVSPVPPTVPPHMRRRQALRWAEWVLGVATLLFWGGWLLDGWGRDQLHAWRTQHPATVVATPLAPTAAATLSPSTLGRSLPVSESAPASSVAPRPTAAPVERAQVAPAPAPDPRPTHLTIRSIGLEASIAEVFLQDGIWQVADYAVGYHHGTGVPGSGNVVLAGHKGMRGSVFARLESVKVGDDIWIDAADRRYHYRVSATGKVWPDQVSVMQPSADPILTLITCTNWDTERFVAVANLVETTGVSSAEPPVTNGHRERS